MRNAKEELLNSVNKLDDILCAKIQYETYDSEETIKDLILKVGHTNEELQTFLNELDFEYDSGFGSQELYGIVWLKDNEAWLERGEYDGSEWWSRKERPTITKEFF